MRRFEASAAVVFEAWLKRAQVEQWMFGPEIRDEEIVHLAIDPRVGGAFSYLLERDGEEVAIVGKYLEIVRPERLVFTWTVADESLGSRVLVGIASCENGCELSLTQELHPMRADERNGVEAEWARRLDSLARLVE